MSRPNNKDIKVRVFKLTNRLKKKLGMRPARFENEEGYVDPDAVKEADELIKELCETCPETIAGHLENIAAKWDKMKDMPRSPEREALSKEIFTLSHEIKDVGSMCGYDLAAFFAESLRDYVGQTELKLEAQRVIIQAHVDALTVVNKQGFKTEEEAGPAAEELKKMVKVAIGKYR